MYMLSFSLKWDHGTQNLTVVTKNSSKPYFFHKNPQWVGGWGWGWGGVGGGGGGGGEWGGEVHICEYIYISHYQIFG